MMTWMTNMSLFDSVETLALPQLALAHTESAALLNELVYAEPDDGREEAPAPLKFMWQGYETALGAYSVAAAAKLVAHGVTAAHSSLEVAATITALREVVGEDAAFQVPPWVADTDVLRSHRSNLMRRWPDVYDWKKTPTNLPYLWPVCDEAGGYELRLSKYDKALIAKGERSIPKQMKDRIENA